MLEDHTRIRVGGAWLAIASVLMISVLGLHGPIAPEPAEQMVRIGNHPVAWTVAHWLAAAALSSYAVAALFVLTARSQLSRTAWSLSAWAVIFVGALWTLNTAVAEATVVTDAAISGRNEVFEAWWAYAEGKANGFAFVALALAFIAASDARAARGATPTWAAWSGMVAAVGSFTGWAAGMWFGVGAGNLVWLASSIVMSAWAAWFGAALVGRTEQPVDQGRSARPQGRRPTGIVATTRSASRSTTDTSSEPPFAV